MDFLLSVAHNNIEKTRHLLHGGIDVNTPILWNAKNTCSPIIPADLASKPELLAKLQLDQVYHARPLNIAVIGGHLEMVRLLLNAGADINTKDGRGRTALICAIYGLDLDSDGINSCNLALISQTHKAHFLIMKQILLRHPNLYVDTLNSPQHEIKGVTPLCLSSYLGKSEIIALLLDDGQVDVNGTDSKNASALMYAARDGNFPIVKMLLDYGASPEITDSHGWSAIQYAEKNLNIIQICEQTLRRKRPDISMIHVPTNPVARYPVRYGHNLSTFISSLPNCQSLLSHLKLNALQEIDLVDPITTPIMHLVQMIFLHSIKSHDHVSLQSLLMWSPPIKRDCNQLLGALLVNQHDAKTGLTTIHHAMRAKPLPSLDTIAMLYQAGADINAQTCYGRTALHHLARIGMNQDGKSWGLQKKSTTPASPPPPDAKGGQPPPQSYAYTPSHLQPAIPTTHFEESTTLPTSFLAHRLSTFSATSSRSTSSAITPKSPTAKMLQDTPTQFSLETPTVPAHLALCVSLLIRLGAVVGIADSTGNTPLHYAVEFGAVPEVLEILIMDGNADLHWKNKKQQTPSDICKTEKIRLFVLALEKKRKESQQIKYSKSCEYKNINTSTHNSHYLLIQPTQKPTTQSTIICNNKDKSYLHDHINPPPYVSEAAPAPKRKKKDDDLNQINLDFETFLNALFNYHTTSTNAIDKDLATMTKTILQSRKNSKQTLFSNSTTTAWVPAGSQKRLLEQTIVQLRYRLQETHKMFDQMEQRAGRVIRHYREGLTRVERMHQMDCDLLELQQDKVEILYNALERMDGQFCQLEQDQNKLIVQVEHWRTLALQRLRWIEQHDTDDQPMKHTETMDSICLDNLMQAMTTLSTISLTTNDQNLCLCEAGIRLSRDLDRIVQKTLQHTTSSSPRLTDTRMALEEKWRQVSSILAKSLSEQQQKGRTSFDITTVHRDRQHLTTSLYSVSLSRDHRSLNELELSFDILSANLNEIQMDMDDLNTQSSLVVESKKWMYDTCSTLEKELEMMEKPQPRPPLQQKRTKKFISTSTTIIAPLDRTPTIVRGELDQVMQYTQTLFDRQCLLDQEAAVLKKEYDNIEYQLDAIKEALRQVRPPLLLQGLLEHMDTTTKESMVYMKNYWRNDENLVPVSFTEDHFEHQPMDLTDESDSTSLSSSSSIFSSASSNNKNSSSSNHNVMTAATTQMKNIFKTPLAIQCLLVRLDISLYSLKILAACHLRRSRQLFLQLQVSLAQVSEEIDDACNQMTTIYDNTAEMTQRVLGFEVEVDTVIQHRKEEIVNVLEVVDQVSIDNGIDMAATQKYHYKSSHSVEALKKHNTTQKSAISTSWETQQQMYHESTVLGGIDNDRDRQQLILRGLERFYVSQKHLQGDMETLKKHQTKLDHRIRYTIASLIDPQLDRLVGQDDSSLLSISGHLSELMGRVRMHDLGLHLNKSTTTPSTHTLSSSSQTSTATNPNSLSPKLSNNQPPFDQLSTVGARSSKATKSQRISLTFSMHSTNRKKPSNMSTSSSLSSLSFYQQERMLSHASTLRQTISKKKYSPQR